MSGIIADNVGRASGLLKAAGGGGKIGQVVTVHKSDSTSVSTSTAVDIPGMSVAITPTATSSKVLILFSCMVHSSSNYGGIITVRGSTLINIADADSSARRTSTANLYDGHDGYNSKQLGQVFLDSPSTTSATTYKLQLNCKATTYINRPQTASGVDNSILGTSNIILMEVLA